MPGTQKKTPRAASQPLAGSNGSSLPKEQPDVLARAASLLDADQPQQALDLLNREKQKGDWVLNAQAVCQLRLGKFEQAMELLRGRVIASSSVCLRGDVPTALAVNFATALLLMGNVPGCQSALHEIEELDHPGVVQLRSAVQKWRGGLSFKEKVRLWLGGAPRGRSYLTFRPVFCDKAHTMSFKQLFARKSLETLHAEMQDENRLRRILGPVALTSLGVGAIIGAGIFVMTGRAAALDAGPAIVLSYGVAGLGCLFAALCYAEFASMAPVAGSAYTYAYATLGELLAWIIGWDLVLEYAMACACVASSWSKYLNEFLIVLFNWQIPQELLGDPFTTGGASWFNLPAFLIMISVTGVLVLGIRESAGVNALLVIVKVAVVLFVIFVGWSLVDSANWTSVPVEDRTIPKNPAEKWGILGLMGLNEVLVPLDDSVRSSFMPYGLSGLMLGASIVFFAYIGFDAVSTHSEEAKRPQRDVPIAILSSLVLCTVLYIGVAAIITGMQPYPKIDPDAAVASAFRLKAEETGSPMLRASAGLIAVGALAGMTSVLLITFLSQARIFLAMARDKLIPPRIFGAIHARFRTPHLSTMLTGAIISIVAAITPILALEEMVNIGTLMAFVIVCAAVLLLRIQRPDAARPFRSPVIWFVAPAGILVNLTLMLFLSWETWLRLVVWLAVGLVIYFGYSMRHSRLGQAMRESKGLAAK